MYVTKFLGPLELAGLSYTGQTGRLTAGRFLVLTLAMRAG